MKSEKMKEILQDIVESGFGVSLSDEMPLAAQLNSEGWDEKLSRLMESELGAAVSVKGLESVTFLPQLLTLVESQLPKDTSGRTIIDIYMSIERLAREEYHPKIKFRWFARWDDFFNTGNWLTSPDSLDAVEIVLRLEEEFGLEISDEDAQGMQTVGQAVQYIWTRLNGG